MRFFFIALTLVACSPSRPVGPPDAAITPVLAEVTAEKTGLIFVYGGEGGPEMVESLSEVPQRSRSAVQVIDQGLSPAQRGAGRFVQVFDLRAPDAAGRFSGRMVPRAGLEAALAEAQATPKQRPIIMYSAAWCGVCKKAAAFMTKEGLAFVEKDIEKDKGAAREYAEKLRKAGKSSSGVPVFDVAGQIMTGFDAATLIRVARGG